VSQRELAQIEGIGTKKAAAIYQSIRDAAADVEAELDRANQLGVSLVSLDDEAYPTLLRSIPDPPPVLYMRGTLEPRDLHAVSIVGSRKCSLYGREQAERFAALLAGAGVTVISGGARGIDSSAHRGAMTHPQGRTVAVLGCGVDVVYPPENTSLFDQIAKRGAVVSEYPIGTPPVAENFPRRNRIISGMSRGVLVIEADIRSGALITARCACDDHGRTVFAVPGRVDNPLSAGPHQLIRDGATLAANLEDILDGLGPLPQQALEPTLFDGGDQTPPIMPAKPEPASPLPIVGLSENQALILEHLTVDPMSVDRLIEQTALPAQAVLQEMTLLTLKGLVKRIDGQTFARKR
jgi:DNA processing protein